MRVAFCQDYSFDAIPLLRATWRDVRALGVLTAVGSAAAGSVYCLWLASNDGMNPSRSSYVTLYQSNGLVFFCCCPCFHSCELELGGQHGRTN